MIASLSCVLAELGKLRKVLERSSSFVGSNSALMCVTARFVVIIIITGTVIVLLRSGCKIT